MAILVTNDTKLCTSGITGREGTFHSLRNRDYGTNLVAGVTPGRGGQKFEGTVPVFNTVADAVRETAANTSVIYVPPAFAADAMLEAADAGVKIVQTCGFESLPPDLGVRLAADAVLLEDEAGERAFTAAWWRGRWCQRPRRCRWRWRRSRARGRSAPARLYHQRHGAAPGREILR